ncbi:ATP-binding cassette domain-containing protein [Cellulomonas triticagri]|uniref:ATP-binding cassette domain-containing protein n=1 Tax=Cellulomonas triticagri TaxID=2483352 RepID=A0A3M2IXD7_9CELL|nr:ATP-binding cassette domain-containing protein [Cellulomonas triticagri]RMI06577.1 ATP-binding cassette domain-containing protein [Cellulomonas triticagri]
MRVTLHGVGHRFVGDDWLFRGIDAEFRRGTVTALTGPSGCGKSTLLALVAASLGPSEGRVDRTGVRRTAWVFQNPHGVARRTALDHVVLPLLARDHGRPEAEGLARDLLDRFGLSTVGTRPFAHLSGGEAQRLMLARAVATAPDLLLVDEPTAQLDPTSAATVSTTLGHLAASGSIVLVATHDPAARRACHAELDLAAR